MVDVNILLTTAENTTIPKKLVQDTYLMAKDLNAVKRKTEEKKESRIMPPPMTLN